MGAMYLHVGMERPGYIMIMELRQHIIFEVHVL